MVDLWESEQLCSKDYVERWRSWLSLPVEDLVRAMTSSSDGWAASMRQNSPFVANV